MKKPQLPVSLTIQPSPKDIIAGTCNSPTKCMFAMCLRRMFPRATYVSVNTNCITITLDGVYYHYSIPRKAVKSIVLYDDKKPIDVARAKVTLQLVSKRPSSYVSTPEVREYQRAKSARYRADPAYVRPESRDTLRAQLAKARTVTRKISKVVKEAYESA